MQCDITFTTMLFDIGRGSLDGGFARSFDHYLESFSKLLKLDISLVIYTEEKVVPHIWKIRKPHNTQVIVKTLDFLREFPFYNEVQSIRKDPKWFNQASWLKDSTQARLELYNCITFMKHFCLNDVSIMNPFSTGYFCFIDAGLANTVNLDQHFNEKTFKLLEKELSRLLYICFPYDGQTEVHGFKKSEMNNFAGQDTKYVCRGGFFGGDRKTINEINGIYYSLLSNTLNQGLMGTEESIFTLISYLYPELCNCRFIENNGLIYKYFEDLINGKYQKSGKDLVFYVLTYNLPQQFELWLKAFYKGLGSFTEKISLICINNSNDPSVAAVYDELCAKHNMEQIKFDNIGINSARIFAGKHFHKSDYKHMIFFEDDMMLQTEETICKNGFRTYDQAILKKCMHIMEIEKLDYLKLSFSEFYGDNVDNWALTNLGNDKNKYPNNGKSTKIDYIKSYKKVPYAVGEFHYCNWPLMFSKEGNKKIFIDTDYGNAYEQHIMAKTFIRMREKSDIKAGCLLMSVINHNRVFHYDGSKRRENSSYTN